MQARFGGTVAPAFTCLSDLSFSSHDPYERLASTSSKPSASPHVPALGTQRVPQIVKAAFFLPVSIAASKKIRLIATNL